MSDLWVSYIHFYDKMGLRLFYFHVTIILFIIWMKNISFLAYWITSRERRNNEGEVSKPMVKLLKIKSSYLDKKNHECVILQKIYARKI